MSNSAESMPPVAKLTYPNGSVRYLQYPDPPQSLVVQINGIFRRPIEVEFLPPGKDWYTERPQYLSVWKDRVTKYVHRS